MTPGIGVCSGDPAPGELAARVREAALALGFARVGFAPARRFERGARALGAWLAAGHHGEMAYLEGPEDRADPEALLPGARSIVVVTFPYETRLVPVRRGIDGPALAGSVAAYARGEDYHLVVRDKLHALAGACSAIAGRSIAWRSCVDTAPLLEREAAAAAGIGFVGKNTLVIAPGAGSNFVLGELLVDLEIEPGLAVTPGCGACRTCLDACPTGAFTGAYELDARRCISYLTIELTGHIPRELRPLIGTRVYGCDACQDVCPYNAATGAGSGAPELAARPALEIVDLVALLELGAASYRRLVRRTALRRSNRATLARNAAVALGNTGDPRAVAPLARALAAHPSALVRAHAAWALGRLGGGDALAALSAALEAESDAAAREEIALALGGAVQGHAARVPSGPGTL